MSARKVCRPKSVGSFVLGISALLVFLSSTQQVEGVTIPVDPVQGAGFVSVDAGGLPQILGAPIGTVLEVDFVFNDMKHIELDDGATTNVEFGIGNTGNNVDLPYRIVFDLSDEHGNLITNEALVVENVALAGVINIVQLELTPLPAVIFHDFHVRVETLGDQGLFDLYVAGGAGGTGTVSGPVIFNRALVGDWAVPEPSTLALAALALVGLVAHRRRRE